MGYFTRHRINDHVTHLFEPLGVGMTLITGSRRALLVDTGFGVGDVAAEVAELTDLPLTVMNTHAHFDHAGGNRQFDEILADAREIPVAETYATDEQLSRATTLAREKGVLPETPAKMGKAGSIVPFPATEIDLGGVIAEIIPMPGHTPGSTGVLLREDRILLIGDDWNPVTWLFFPECLSVAAYRETILRLLELPFDKILCPHATELRDREDFARYAASLASIAVGTSQKVTIHPYEKIDTRAYPREGMGALVFDAAKL